MAWTASAVRVRVRRPATAVGFNSFWKKYISTLCGVWLEQQVSAQILRGVAADEVVIPVTKTALQGPLCMDSPEY